MTLGGGLFFLGMSNRARLRRNPASSRSSGSNQVRTIHIATSGCQPMVAA